MENSRDAGDIADDDNVVWIGDLARESVFLAHIAMQRRRRAQARERKTVTRIEIDTGCANNRKELKPRDGKWSDTGEDHGSDPRR